MNSSAIPGRTDRATGDLMRPVQSVRPKLAQRIALALGHHIVEAGLSKGDPLGSEAELAERFATSRWTMREALSILRREGQIEIRRGRMGGYFVADADAAPLSGAIRSYLEFIDVGIDEIIGARRIFNALVLRLAIARITIADGAALRAADDCHKALLAATRNPVAQLFARSARRFEIVALLRSSFDKDDYAQRIAGIEGLRTAQIEAVIADDFAEAWRLETMILDRSEEMLRRSFRPAADMTPALFLQRAEHFLGKQGRMKPELLIHQLAADIIARGWPVGAHLGYEPELLARYNVGRAAFREALRPLEQTGLVVMQTGRRSGLKVGAPSLDRVIATSLVQFARLRATRADLCEVMEALMVGASGEAARLGAKLSRADGADPVHFFDAVAAASGNRIVRTMVRILIAQFRAAARSDPRSPPDWDAVLPLREHLIGTINEGDVAAARRAALALSPDAAPWPPEDGRLMA